MLALFGLLFLLTNVAKAQDDCTTGGFTGLAISEVTADGAVEIFNGTAGTIDLAEYYLYTSPAYRQLEDLAFDCGETALAPGEVLVVSDLPGFDSSVGEVGLYTTDNFTDPDALVAYLEYGQSGQKRSNVAVAAGLWNTANTPNGPFAGNSLQASVGADGGLAYAAAAANLCSVATNLVSQTIEVDGGALSFADGSTQISTCIEGIDDMIEAIRDGNSVGPNRDFVITDDSGNILALPPGNGPFNFDPAGPGTCEIWYLAYADGLEGLAEGGNLSDLAGCFDLSNPLTVIREVADGGTVTLADGGTNFIGCAGDIVFDVTHTTTAPNLSYWYIITDDADNILGFHNSTDGPTLDLSGAPAGTCRIWGWSYRGLPDPVVGEPLSSIAPDGSCADISDDFITVYREITDGGTITTLGGASDTTVVAGDAFVTVTHTTSAQFLSYWYIITDEDGTILGFANSANTNTLNLSGAPAGICRIWGWSYRGLGDPVPGENIATLTDDFCETISADFVEVNREAANDALEDVIINEVGVDGRIEFYNGTDAAVDVSGYWLCNFPAYDQLSSLTVECGDLVIQPGDYLVLSGWDAFDATDAEIGLYRTSSFGSSSAIVSYLEYGSSGHVRANVAISAGIWTPDFFLTAPTTGTSIQTFVEDGDLSWENAPETFCAENESTTSSGFISDDVEINVFPNPANHTLSIDIDGLPQEATTFELFDAAGRQVLRREQEAGNGVNSLDVSQLPTGTYLLRIINDGAFATRRITVL